MLTLTGMLAHVFKAPDRASKDGESIEGAHKVQIMGKNPLANGEVRMDLVTLTAHNVEDFEGFEGSEITVPVGVFATKGGTAHFFIPKGASPRVA